MSRYLLKADPGDGNDDFEAFIWTVDEVAVGDCIEVDLVDKHEQHARVWLDVEKRNHTPEGEVELLVSLEGYDLDQLREAVNVAGEQYAER